MFRKLIVAVCFCTLAFLAFLGWRLSELPESGWCERKNRVISDAEFIHAVELAVEKELKSMVTVIDESGGRTRISVKEKFFPYWDFSPGNPLCCQVLREDRSYFLRAIFGGGDITVEVSRENNSFFQVGNDENYRFVFDTCGVLRWSDVGLPNTGQRMVEVQ